MDNQWMMLTVSILKEGSKALYELLKMILISWPLAIVLIVLLLKKSLNELLLNRLITLRVGGVELEIAKLFESIDKNLEETNEVLKNDDESSEQIKVESSEQLKPEEKPEEKTETSNKTKTLKFQGRFKNKAEKVRIKSLKNPAYGMRYVYDLFIKELNSIQKELGQPNEYPEVSYFVISLYNNNLVKDNLVEAIMDLLALGEIAMGNQNYLSLKHSINDFTMRDAQDYFSKCSQSLIQLRLQLKLLE
ncbi:hypothetical protein [Bacillus sp. A1]|uniref:hypothetical protein n=1 Tax=Bacillus sp. A1 TaxID=228104 RepID=UPI0035D69893